MIWIFSLWNKLQKKCFCRFQSLKYLIFSVPYKYYQIFQWINSLFYLFSTNWKLWQREQASPELVHRRESKPLLNWSIAERSSLSWTGPSQRDQASPELADRRDEFLRTTNTTLEQGTSTQYMNTKRRKFLFRFNILEHEAPILTRNHQCFLFTIFKTRATLCLS